MSAVPQATAPVGPSDPVAEIRRVDAESARRGDLFAWLRLAWPAYATPPHIRLLGAALEAAEAGDVRLMVEMPPRHGKSMAVAGWIARYLLRRAHRSVIHVTYGQEYAEDWGRRVRRVIAEQAVWPERSILPDSRSASRLTLDHGAEYFAVGRGGPITGRGAHLLVIDDPLKDRDEADSPAIRRQLHQWYAEVAYTRLMPGGSVVIVSTRWHEDDLAGWLTREHAGQGWRVIRLPALAVADDPLGRPLGEALWPERFPAARLEEIRAQLSDEQGSRAWSALYQQSPIPAEGALLRAEWFRRWTHAPIGVDFRVLSYDTAAKDRDIHDWSVGQAWARAESGYFLEHQYRAHWDYPTLRRCVSQHALAHRPDAVLIEDAGTGTALIADLQASTRLPVVPVTPRQSKVTRAQAVSPLLESGRVWIPEGVPWGAGLLDECAAFPLGANDDQVDAMTQALAYLRAARPIAVDGPAEIPLAGGM